MQRGELVSVGPEIPWASFHGIDINPQFIQAAGLAQEGEGNVLQGRPMTCRLRRSEL
jgi:hypothetical protein